MADEAPVLGELGPGVSRASLWLTFASEASPLWIPVW